MNSDEIYETVSTITDLSGNSKQSFLKVQHPGICKYLLAAYDPFTRYYITKCSKGEGDQLFDEGTWLLLEKLSTRELSGANAQGIVNTITRGMTRRSADLFQKILKKDLRIGMGAKSINKVYPGLIPTHDVMLAKLFEEDRVKFPCFGSPKIDGVRAKYKKQQFFSRGGHPYVGLNHLTETLHDFTEELDVELTVDDTTFQEGSGLIRNDSPTPNAVMHLIELPTIKVRLIERLMMLTDLNAYRGNYNIRYVPRKKLYNLDDVYSYYKVCRNIGFEGTVITPFDYEYVGTRSYNWMKMKNVETVDLRIENIYEGKGKYKGCMGGAIVQFNDKPNKVGGGWSDEQRKWFWETPSQLLGKTIEILYMEETDDGNMRHARFVGFREDKDD